MKLKPRLQMVADLVPAGKVIADVGTDHAYLPAYLVIEGFNPWVIAVDTNVGSLVKSQRLLQGLSLENKVELRRGDGLKALHREDGVEVVVMAGLGGRTMARLLEDCREFLGNLECLVLQPMSEDYLLRRWLFSRGMYLKEERLARENSHFYKVMQAVPGKPKNYTDPVLMEIGPRLVEKPDPLLVPYLRLELSRYIKIVNELEKGTAARSRRKARYYRGKIERIKEVLAVARKNSTGNRFDGRTGSCLPGPGE